MVWRVWICLRLIGISSFEDIQRSQLRLHTRPVFGVAFDTSIELIYGLIIYGWKSTDVYFLEQKLEFNLEH